MEKFKLSDQQAEYILETKLRQIARISEMALTSEKNDLEKQKSELNALLDSPTKFKNLVKKELKATAAEYGDERRSPIVEREVAQVISERDLTPAEPVTVVLSKMGWVRAAKGYLENPETLSYKQGAANPICRLFFCLVRERPTLLMSVQCLQPEVRGNR